MKFAVPFPLLDLDESIYEFIRIFSPYRQYIDYFYFRIPYIEGRDSSFAGKLYAEKCKSFIDFTKGRFKTVLDIKLNASRPSINRYYRSNYINKIIDGYGFDGIIIREIGNAAYFSDAYEKLEIHYLTNNINERLLGLLQTRVRLESIIGVGSGCLGIFADISKYPVRRSFIVNETCYDNCRARQFMFSGRVGTNGFCKNCMELGGGGQQYYISPEKLYKYVETIDTAVISGALNKRRWVETTFMHYFLHRKTEMRQLLNGVQIKNLYD